MKQTTTTLNGKELMLIEIAEGITGEGMHVDTGTLFWSSEVNMPFTGWDCHFDPAPVIPDDFKLLGLCPEIKEEIAAGLVEAQFDTYRDYRDTDDMDNLSCYTCTTAIESLHSFVKAHHFNPETTVILIKE